jgi:hypothetical protein
MECFVELEILYLIRFRGNLGRQTSISARAQQDLIGQRPDLIRLVMPAGLE